MALINCPECGKSISDKAHSCPHCGYVSQSQIKLLNLQSTDNVQPPSETNTKTLKRNSTRSSLFKYLICFCVVLICCTFVYKIAILTPTEEAHVNSITKSIEKLSLESSSKTEINRIITQYEELSTKEKIRVKNKKDLFELAEAKRQQDINHVINVINTINSPVSLSDKDSVSKAITLYNALTDDEKQEISNYNLLSLAEKQINQLSIDAVITAINDLPDTHSVSIQDNSKVQSALKLYNALSSDQQKLVSNASKLTQVSEAVDKAIGTDISQKINQYAQKDSIEYWQDGDIRSLESEYSALTSNQKKYVTNYGDLQSVRKKCNLAIEQQELIEKTINIGDTINSEYWQITLQNARITNAIYPADTSGYYTYRHPHAGNLFVDLVFTLKNTSSVAMAFLDAFDDVTLTYGNSYKYTSYKMMFSNDSYVEIAYDWDGIGPLQSQKVHVVFSVPEEAKNSTKSLVATLEIDGQEKIINIK